MALRTDIFDLGRLQLASGEARQLDLEVAVGSIQLAGQTYTAQPERTPVRLDASRMVGGYSLRLRFAVKLDGPCMRCLDPATRSFEIDAREIDQPNGGSEELDSPYVHADELDLQAWARDSLVLELPAQIVCSDDCKGICPVCGENLNHADPDHHHEKPPDPRWSKLSELKLD